MQTIKQSLAKTSEKSIKFQYRKITVGKEKSMRLQNDIRPSIGEYYGVMVFILPYLVILEKWLKVFFSKLFYTALQKKSPSEF